MDKEILTSTDINALLSASKKLSPGETAIGSVTKTEISKTTGELKTITAFRTTDEKESVNMTGYTQDRTGEKHELTGSINYDSVKRSRSNHRPTFRLRETFFRSFKKIEKEVKMRLLNAGDTIYYCDEDGRVYLETINGVKIYVNAKRNAGVDEYGKYYAFENTDSGLDLISMPEIDTTYFDYLYLTEEDKEEARIQEEKREEEKVKEFFTPINPYQYLFDEPDSKLDFKSQKVVDFEEYKRQMEESGPRR